MPTAKNATAWKRARRQRPNRHKVSLDAAQSDFLTAADAREETAWLVLEILLKRIPRSMCKSVMTNANAAADELAIYTRTAEVEALFTNIAFEDTRIAPRLSRCRWILHIYRRLILRMTVPLCG